ncbi:uncharacterized protein BO95DRAFT_502334 [Aspergillus brunneoviolaceus CBS 621.78]|uniref:Uncharacterized protein n=1 Tax=Aspergillus brunneoviolaceus CBS 621.78 TaxID=1450534 RepID=A0ACD1G1L3_9EURO|nr:hypothetical protein BO95DRAFT_502334 [Aspergillus brunneoviolaceus CBS 621.78]RAH43166.1 hypothetical protein BO95DRAFT_502334 [Aspergillus brunneoviolaceus CBS 621.78]
MNRLPVEIKQMIADVIGDVSRDSLRDLSQVNHEWHEIAGPGVYGTLLIHLEAKKPARLDRVIRLLDATLILPLVKHVILLNRDTRRSIAAAKDERLCRYLRQSPPEDIIVPGLGVYMGDWNPIIRLVQRLTSLKRFDFLIHMYYPPELLHVLAQAHPHCHVSVSLRCSFYPAEDFSRKRWAQSPVLHAVRVIYYEDPVYETVHTEHPDRSLRDLLRQAPHIKQVSLQISPKTPGSTRQNYTKWLESRPPESGIDTSPTRARLEILSLPLSTTMTGDGFQAWSRVTDLGYLTAWTAGALEEESALAAITDLQPFRALKRLTISLQPPADSLPSWSQTIQAMFDSLPPLTYLCLLGTYDPTILPTAVLDRHGSTLVELKLHRETPKYQSYESTRLAQKGQIAPMFPADAIRRMAVRCPRLKTLRICVQRHRGHPTETEAYKALGEFPALETLDLVLNCLPVVQDDGTPFPPRALSEYEQGHNQDHVPRWILRDCAINCAIDAPLAAAIFKRIHPRPQRGTLRLLRLHPLAGHHGQYRVAPEISNSQALLARGYLNFQVMGKWQVAWDGAGWLRPRNRETTRWEGRRSAVTSADLEIFESIWPLARATKDWPLDWQSWPLQ